ncbi:MAG: alpha/beta fold hydrolase [Opitutae bacterium]|nr:alpha/beta fold hydrolase [Opitutae bacterium]
MKFRLLVALLGFTCAAILPAVEPTSATTKQPVLVTVHGAWAGGWHFKKVAPLLEAKGWKVYRPSLSGLGEHFNTARADIGLPTHIDDIVNFILFEDLHDVILLGHSYGGMVITGVADRIPERIARLVYLDAFVPENGESVMAMHKTAALQVEKDGFIIPTWVKPGKPFPIDVPHPRKTFSDPITLNNQTVAARIPATYILTVEKGGKPEDDAFFPAAERARARGWPVLIMEGDHNPHWRQPVALAELLGGIR